MRHHSFPECLENAPQFMGAGVGEYTLYLLYDERDLGVRYVGVTRSPGSRAAEHFLAGSGNRHLIAWKRSGGRPVFRVVDSACRGSWEAAEREWIKHMRSLGLVLNMHQGGRLDRDCRTRGVRDPVQLYVSQHESKTQLRDFKGKLPMTAAQKLAKREKQARKNQRRRANKRRALMAATGIYRQT